MTLMGAAIKAGLSLLAALLLALAASAPAIAATFSAKRGINMDIWVTWPDESRWGEREALLPFPEWRKSVGASELAALKDAGFDFVRLPIDPSPFLSAKAAALHGELLASVVESARMINAAGLKVIVDLHLFAAGGNRSIGMQHVMADPALFERYLGLVRTMGRAIASEDPRMVAFELMNEPEGGCDGAAQSVWEDRLVRLFAAARSSATRLTLILSGSCGGSADGLVAIDPGLIPDDNVIWSFHSYAPFLLTHQGATWAGDFIPHVTGLPYPPHSVPRAELDAALDKVRETIRRDAPWSRRAGLLSYLDELVAEVDTEEKLEAVIAKPFDGVGDWAKRHGVAPDDILLGEFGMIRQEWQNPNVVPAAHRAAYYRDVIGVAEDRGYGWAMWGYGGAFGIVEEFDGRKAEPNVLDAVRGLD